MLIPTDSDRLGAVSTGHVEPVMPWIEKDGRRQPGTDQERDEASGMLLWTVHAMVPIDTRPMLISVRVPARECPQPAPFEPIAFERLVCNARVNRQNGQLGTYWNADGLVDVRTRQPQDVTA